VRCDRIVDSRNFYPRQNYFSKLSGIRYVDPDIQKQLTYLTNNFTLPADTVADLYRCRWQVELFFKCTKQDLRIKAFYGTTENAVKTQI
jgi:IS4 transposase